MKKILLTTALAFASILSASAANPTGATAGSLMLDFQDTADNVAFDYEVSLGLASTIGTTPIPIGTVDTYVGAPALLNDLSTTFGTGWATNPNVTWSVLGVHSANGGTDTTFYDTSSDNQQSQASTGNVYGSLRPIASTLSQTPILTYPKGAQVGATVASSYSAEFAGAGNGQAFNAFNDPTESTGVGPANDIELYYYTGQDTDPIDIGKVDFASNGTLTISATPEPSSYALGICALVLFTVLARRKSLRA